MAIDRGGASERLKTALRDTASVLKRPTDVVFDGKTVQRGLTDMDSKGNKLPQSELDAGTSKLVNAFKKPRQTDVRVVIDPNGMLNVVQNEKTLIGLGSGNNHSQIESNAADHLNKLPNKDVVNEVRKQIQELRQGKGIAFNALMGREVSTADISETQDKLVKIAEQPDSKVGSVQMNFMGNRPNQSESNAVMSTIATQYIVEHAADEPGKLMSGLQSEMNRAIHAYKISDANADPSFAISIVGKDGDLAFLTAGDAAVKIVRKDYEEEPGIVSNANSLTSVHERVGKQKVQPGEKIILTTADQLFKIDPGQSAEHIAERVSTENSAVVVTIPEKEPEWKMNAFPPQPESAAKAVFSELNGAVAALRERTGEAELGEFKPEHALPSFDFTDGEEAFRRRIRKTREVSGVTADDKREQQERIAKRLGRRVLGKVRQVASEYREVPAKWKALSEQRREERRTRDAAAASGVEDPKAQAEELRKQKLAEFEAAKAAGRPATTAPEEPATGGTPASPEAPTVVATPVVTPAGEPAIAPSEAASETTPTTTYEEYKSPIERDRTSHTPPYWKVNGEVPLNEAQTSVGEKRERIVDGKKVEMSDAEKAKELLEKAQGKYFVGSEGKPLTPEQELKLLEEVMDRVQYPGDYKKEKDDVNDVVREVIDRTGEDRGQTLLALEVRKAQLLKEMGKDLPDNLPTREEIRQAAIGVDQIRDDARRGEAENRVEAPTDPDAPRRPEAAPVGDRERQLPPAPVQQRNGERETPPPAPIPGEQPAPLEMSMDLGVAGVDGRESENYLKIAQHMRATAQEKVPTSKLAKVPVVGGMLYGLRHPIKTIWQNGIARSIFDQQDVRFAASMSNIVKDKLGDRSIPTDVSLDLVDRALTEGNKSFLQEGIGTRAVWKVRNFFNGITAIGSNSEQAYAKKWLKTELEKPPSDWKANLGVDIQSVLKQQDDLGQRFAVKTPEGMTVEQVNSSILREQLGERRVALPQEMRADVNNQLKQFIREYAQSTGADQDKEELVMKVNNYFRSNDFRGRLSPEELQMMNANEMASNIVSVADKIKPRWSEYEAQSENGRSKWDEFQMNIYLGKAEWGAVGGKTEMGFLTDRLAERLAGRNNFLHSRSASYAAGMVKDIGLYAGAYGAGWLLVGARLGTSPLAKSFGGVLGAAGLTFVKETGIRIGGRTLIKGLTRSEAEQLSRERAINRENPAESPKRKDLERALVKMTEFSKAISSIEGAQDPKALLVAIADVEARLRRTDMSGQNGNEVQNYFIYSEGKENEEMLKLRSAVLNGKVALRTMARNPANEATFNTLFTAANTGDFDALLNRYRTLANAQLQVSSFDAGRIERYMKRNEVPDADIAAMMRVANLRIGEGESIREKEKVLTKIALRRGATRAVQTVLGGAVGSAAFHLAQGLVADTVNEVRNAHDLGWKDYTHKWDNLVHGKIPIHRNAAGVLESDITPYQKAVMQVNALTERTADSVRHHVETIGNSKVSLPNTMGYAHMTGGEDVLVNLQNGDVVDITNKHFEVRAGDWAMVDNATGTATPASEMFGGVVVMDEEVSSMKTILNGGTGQHVQSLNNHPVTIPNGTELLANPATGRVDLVVTGHPDKVLLTGVSVDVKGHLSWTGRDGLIQVSESEVKIPGDEIKVINPDGNIDDAEWGKHNTEIVNRHWHSENQLKFYNHLDNQGRVVLDIKNVPIHGHADKGFYFTLPGHANQGIFVQADSNGQLTLDSTSTKVVGPNGLTLGRLSQMVVNQEALSTFKHASELTNRQDIFNLGLNGKPGFIEAAYVEGKELHVGATIMGTHGVPTTIGSPDQTAYTQSINLNGAVTETVKTRIPAFGPPPVWNFAFPQNLTDITLFPLPMRENIERSTTGQPVGSSSPNHGPATPPAATPQQTGTSPSESPAPTPVEEQATQQEVTVEEEEEVLHNIIPPTEAQAAELIQREESFRELESKANRTPEEERQLQEDGEKLKELNIKLDMEKTEKVERAYFRQDMRKAMKDTQVGVAQITPDQVKEKFIDDRLDVLLAKLKEKNMDKLPEKEQSLLRRKQKALTRQAMGEVAVRLQTEAQGKTQEERNKLMEEIYTDVVVKRYKNDFTFQDWHDSALAEKKLEQIVKPEYDKIKPFEEKRLQSRIELWQAEMVEEDNNNSVRSVQESVSRIKKAAGVETAPTTVVAGEKDDEDGELDEDEKEEAKALNESETSEELEEAMGAGDSQA